MSDKVRLIDANALIEDFKNDLINSCMEALRGNPHDSILITNVIERIEDAPTIEVDNWISVKDRLPPYGERVLVVNEAYKAEWGYIRYNCGVTARDPHLDFTFWGHKVTHWQPLPEPPKEEAEGWVDDDSLLNEDNDG